MADADQTRKEEQRAEVKSSHEGSSLVWNSVWPLAIAVGLGTLVWFFPLQKPAPGVAIGPSRYSVNLLELRSSREKWGLNGTGYGDGMQQAADKLATSFVRFSQDDGLYGFLNESAQQGAVWARVQHYTFWSLQRFLGWSRTDASALLGRQLHVASEEQMRVIMKASQEPGGGASTPPTLLDIGSGTGSETMKLASALGIDSADVTCLESSASMRSTLAARGFKVASSVDEIKGAPFKAVALLNVLDRCDEPLSLLRAAIELLEPDGLLLVATPLPFDARVYEGRFLSKWGKAANRPPQSPMRVPSRPKSSRNFEFGAAAFLSAAFPVESGIELQSWTKLPYVSSGDVKKTHYVMDIALFVFRVPEGAQLKARAAAAAAMAMDDEESELAGAEEGDGVPAVSDACQGKAPDAIYSWLSETMDSQGVESWGHVLDAGGGMGSFCWLVRQDFNSLIEVTATSSGTYGGDKMLAAAAGDPRAEVVLGNWKEEAFLAGAQFDVVVADYLLGAIEYHWQYGADRMMDRLLDAVQPGGFLLLVGMEPYETVMDRTSAGWHERVLLDVEALGDAAAVLAGLPTYRELPEEWVLQQLRRREEFEVVASKQFAMRPSAKTLRTQLRFARRNARDIENAALKKVFLDRCSELDKLLDSYGTFRGRARNYALVAQRRQV